MQTVSLRPYSDKRTGLTALHLALLAVLAMAWLPVRLDAQVKIVLSDLFTQPGLYYRAYANNYDPSDTTGGTAYSVPSGLIGGVGANQFWDFSSGPTNEVLRFDYVLPAGMAEAQDFPDAKLVEQETVEGAANASPVYLFFEPVAGTGRKVYGFYADLSNNPLFGSLGFTLSPSSVFVPPIVDFPDPITYGLEWSTSMTYQNDFTSGDTGDGAVSAAQQISQASNFKADAYGTIVLPDALGGAFGQGLRITEDVTIDVSFDLGDGFQHFDTEYTRNYYWMMPGYGLVAQLNSTQSTTPLSTNITRAVAFVRMFDTNKKISNPSDGGGTCSAPAPVTDLRIRVSKGVILLTWTKVDCASQYKVQYTETPAVSSSWTDLGAPTANAVWQGENTANGKVRFYRVVSMK